MTEVPECAEDVALVVGKTMDFEGASGAEVVAVASTLET